MPKFNVTYEIVTPKSAEHGEFEEQGFISKDMSLRAQIEAATGKSMKYEPATFKMTNGTVESIPGVFDCTLVCQSGRCANLKIG